MALQRDQLPIVFGYNHADEAQRRTITTIMQGAEAFARLLMDTLPQCADREAALRKVREAMTTATGCVVLRGAV